jgi:MOSC domain-containing protein YiiM
MGYVHAIFIAEAAKQPLRAIEEARVLAERGLEGDRYAAGAGAFSRWPGSGRAVTYIAKEALDAVRNETGIDLSAGESRRNIVTVDVELSELNGEKFRIGSAVLRGARLCAPCAYLERLTVPGVFDALKGRGGLRADVVEPGVIRVGDTIERLPAGTR